MTGCSGGSSSSSTNTTPTVTLLSIAVTPANPSIAPGTTETFIATGTYSNNTTQNITASVTWSSSVASVATITNGKATCDRPGPNNDHGHLGERLGLHHPHGNVARSHLLR